MCVRRVLETIWSFFLWQKMYTLFCRCRLVEDAQNICHLSHFVYLNCETQSDTYKQMATSLTALRWLLEMSSGLKSLQLKPYIWAASVPTKNCWPSPLRAMEVTAFSSWASLREKGDVGRDFFFLLLFVLYLQIHSDYEPIDFTGTVEKRKWEGRIVHREGQGRLSPDCCNQI